MEDLLVSVCKQTGQVVRNKFWFILLFTCIYQKFYAELTVSDSFVVVKIDELL